MHQIDAKAVDAKSAAGDDESLENEKMPDRNTCLGDDGCSCR